MLLWLVIAAFIVAHVQVIRRAIAPGVLEMIKPHGAKSGVVIFKKA
jgi:hypothetical protein